MAGGYHNGQQSSRPTHKHRCPHKAALRKACGKKHVKPICKKLKSTPNNSVLLGNIGEQEEEIHGNEKHD